MYETLSPMLYHLLTPRNLTIDILSIRAYPSLVSTTR